MKKIIVILLLTFSTLALADLRRQDGADVPVGTIISVAGSSCPAGFIKNDGTAVSRTGFPKLFASVGTKYGVGDGSTTFNLAPIPFEFFGVSVGTQGVACSTATCTPVTTIGARIINVTRTSAGTYPVNLVAGLNGEPVCSLIIHPAVNQTYKCQIQGGGNSINQTVLCFNGTTPTDEGWAINCYGQPNSYLSSSPINCTKY